MSQDGKPIREADLLVDQLVVSSAIHIAVPSVGVDVSEHHVRTAVVRKLGDKLSVRLATYSIEALASALSCARRWLDEQQTATGTTEKVSVYYTGRVNSEIEKQLATTFEQAKSIERQDKLTSHNLGAYFLVGSGLPDEQLFHDNSDFEKNYYTKAQQDFEAFKYFMPAKMLDMLTTLQESVEAHGDKRFPLTLSLVGGNNVLTTLDDDGNYSVLDARCNGAIAMSKLWRLAKTADCKVDDFAGLMELAQSGDRCKIDSLVSDIVEAMGFYGSMPRDMPVFNFGKMEYRNRSEVALEDLARAIIGMVTDMIFGKAMDLSMMSKAYRVYYGGSVIQYELVRREILRRYTMWVLPGVKLPKFFKIDATAALGACCQRTSA